MNTRDHEWQLPEASEVGPGLPRTLAEVEQHVQQAVTDGIPLGPIPNGVKRGFNRIRGPKALPVMGRKLVELEQLLPVFLETGRRLQIFGFIDLPKDLKGVVGSYVGLRPPGLVQSVSELQPPSTLSARGCFLDLPFPYWYSHSSWRLSFVIEGGFCENNYFNPRRRIFSTKLRNYFLL